MGSYLSEPVTDKISVDELNDKLRYGASSMQGWRVTQEDAHNALLDFDENTAFFAVYDGHGGQEVAQYCSQKLPQFIKDTEAYKKGDIEQALIEGFLGFDASIATPEVVEVLKELAGEKEAEESDGEENYNHLYEEASMPIEKVIEKYTNLVNPTLKNLKKGDKMPRSPVIAKKESCATSCAASSSGEADSNSLDAEEGCSSSSTNDVNVSEAGCSSSTTTTTKSEPDSSSSTTSEVNGGSSKNEADGKSEDSTPTSNGSIPEIKVTSPTEKKEANSSDNEVSESVPENREVIQNGDVGSGDEVKDEKKDAVSSSVDSEVVSIKGKGKSPMKKSPKTPVVNERPKRNATQLYKKLLDFPPESEEEDTEDEEDKTFMEPEGSSDEEEEAGSEESSAADEEDEEGEEEEDEDEHELEFARNMKEEPGSDSGCTAVVALLKGRDLYVANAGDSRCVVSRKGVAIEMSFDHKPEDEPERARIVKAGGKVTVDGRVNGGLNLSRAIGDHAYKQNKELNNKEQMITALPDIKKLTINPDEDEFMVLACDGIWNYMSSQEVVDFVKTRIENSSDKISHICEEMFDHCLAPNTAGDGTGCDNMTAIVVKFNSNLKKRSMSPEPSNSDEAEAKRPKTEQPQSVETSSSSS